MADSKIAYRTVEFHLLDTGHFELEEGLDQICALMRDFLDRKVPKGGGQ